MSKKIETIFGPSGSSQTDLVIGANLKLGQTIMALLVMHG